MVASFAFLPGRAPESLTRTLKWRQGLFSLGLAWLFLGFFGYLRFKVGSGAPAQFIEQFMGPRATLSQTLGTMGDLLGYGLGAWAVLACFAPRVAVLAFPWLWSLCGGLWSLRYLGTEEWHHVRYTVLPVAMVLAAGVIGYSRLGVWLRSRRLGWVGLALMWCLAAVGSGVGMRELNERMARIPQPISRQEADAIRSWIAQVAPRGRGSGHV